MELALAINLLLFISLVFLSRQLQKTRDNSIDAISKATEISTHLENKQQILDEVKSERDQAMENHKEEQNLRIEAEKSIERIKATAFRNARADGRMEKR